MTDLDKLIEAVKAGDVTTMKFDDALGLMSSETFGCAADVAERAYHGSLDAAHALHKAVLPGWFWFLKASEAIVGQDDDRPNIVVRADTPARAWLLAILLVLRGMQE